MTHKKPEPPNKYELEALAKAKYDELETLNKFAADSVAINKERIEKIQGFIERQLEIDHQSTMIAVKISALMFDIAVMMGMAEEQQSDLLVDRDFILAPSSKITQ